MASNNKKQQLHLHFFTDGKIFWLNMTSQLNRYISGTKMAHVDGLSRKRNRNDKKGTITIFLTWIKQPNQLMMNFD
jgi:hypothetical protein